MRITTNSALYMYKSNLLQSSNTMYKAMNKVMTKRNFDSYAENPAGATRAFKIHSALNATGTQGTNNETVLSKFRTAWSIEDQVVEELTKDLAQVPILEGMNQTNLDSLNSYSETIRSGADSIVHSMNGKYGDAYIFNGADTQNPPFAIVDAVKEAGGTETYPCLTFRGWKVSVPKDTQTGGGDPYLSPEGYQVYQSSDGIYAYVDPNDTTTAVKYTDGNGVEIPAADLDPGQQFTGPDQNGYGAKPMSNANVYDRLEEMNNEHLYVDIGLGFEVDGDGVIPSTAFDSALSGLDFLGFGVDDNGSPNNMVDTMLQISEIFGQYQHAEGGGTWGTAGNYDDASRLVDKFNEIRADMSDKHTSLSAEATYLETNYDQLDETFFVLNSERASIEDVDMADAISELSWADTCYKAALQVGTKVINQSLMDYIQ